MTNTTQKSLQHPLPGILFAVLLIAQLFAGCSNQKGGDHVPELETYSVPSLPSAAFQAGLTAREVSAQYFRRFVHISETYNICLPLDAFGTAEIQSLETAFKSKDAASINKSGLETVINRVLATVSKYNSQRSKFSSRIDIRVTDATEGGCHTILRKSSASDFPGGGNALEQRRFIIYYAGQLKTSDDRVNKIPVIYLNKDLSSDDQLLAMKQSVGAFIGLGSSGESQSLLNTDAAGSTSSLTYLLENSSGATNTNDDAAILYGFGLMYQDVLKPADLSSFQYYVDHLAPGAVEDDKDITQPSGSTNIAYTDVQGSRYIEGVRKVSTQITVCPLNLSNKSISDSWWSQSNYLDFTTNASEPRTSGGLFYQLHSKNATFAPAIQIASTNCNMLVVVKNQSQYPFANNTYNGLFVHEGQIRGNDGVVFSIPVIYLNASNLTLEPQNAATAQGRYIGDVLQHEFAHFLGFRHSTSSTSILAPSGYNRTWDMQNGDGDIMQAFLDRWSK